LYPQERQKYEAEAAERKRREEDVERARVAAELARLAAESRRRAEERKQEENRQRREADRKRHEQEHQQREVEAAARKRQESDDQEQAERMERWKRSGMPREWVLEHLDGWDHPTWMSLVGRVKATPFWPLKAEEMVAYLEGLRDELRVERDRNREEQRQREAERKLVEVAARKKPKKAVKRNPLCERCGQSARVRKERYCKECRKVIICELETAGYLTLPSPKQLSEEKGRKPIRSSEWFSHQSREDDYSEESEP